MFFSGGGLPTLDSEGFAMTSGAQDGLLQAAAIGAEPAQPELAAEQAAETERTVDGTEEQTAELSPDQAADSDVEPPENQAPETDASFAAHLEIRAGEDETASAGEDDAGGEAEGESAGDADDEAGEDADGDAGEAADDGGDGEGGGEAADGDADGSEDVADDGGDGDGGAEDADGDGAAGGGDDEG